MEWKGLESNGMYWNKPDSTACNFVWINKWVE